MSRASKNPEHQRRVQVKMNVINPTPPRRSCLRIAKKTVQITSVILPQLAPMIHLEGYYPILSTPWTYTLAQPE